MSAEFDNLVRAMELACRRINPPHQPNISRFPLSALGAEILKDQIESPEWENTYLRGIEEKALKRKRPPLTPCGIEERALESKRPPRPPFTVRADNTVAVSALTALADGRVVSGSDDATLRVWREASGQWQGTELTGHASYVSALTTLADSRIVSGSLDKTLRVWSEVNGQWHSVELSGHTDFVYALTTLPDGRIVSGSGDKTLRVWREVGKEWQSEVVASTPDFSALARRPGQLLSAGEAIMIWTIPPTGHARKVIRLLVADSAISITDYNDDGSIKVVRITPSEADREWQTTFDPANLQGKPLPCDPLLHQHAAFVDANEQRFEARDCPDQFAWEGLTENGARTLVLYGEPQAGI